ncbi:MAG: alpha/beta hydrolase [Candidatus Helarchaeota archaeon]
MKKKEFKILSNGIFISGTYLIPIKEKGPYNLLIICHGIPSIEGKKLSVEEKGYLLISEEFSKNGFLSVVFNFQGCKGSSGTYSPLNWIANLNSVIEFIHDKFEILKIFILSFSGGAMISVRATAENPIIDFLITCACPSDLSKQSKFRYFLRDGLLMSFHEQNLDSDQILKELEEINPLNWVKDISPREILILHGKKDDLIPFSHSQMLYDHAKEPKDIHFFNDLGHKLRKEREVIKYALNWCLKKIKNIKNKKDR